MGKLEHELCPGEEPHEFMYNAGVEVRFYQVPKSIFKHGNLWQIEEKCGLHLPK